MGISFVLTSSFCLYRSVCMYIHVYTCFAFQSCNFARCSGLNKSLRLNSSLSNSRLCSRSYSGSHTGSVWLYGLVVSSVPHPHPTPDQALAFLLSGPPRNNRWLEISVSVGKGKELGGDGNQQNERKEKQDDCPYVFHSFQMLSHLKIRITGFPGNLWVI